jgi:hypothetical protein
MPSLQPASCATRAARRRAAAAGLVVAASLLLGVVWTARAEEKPQQEAPAAEEGAKDEGFAPFKAYSDLTDQLSSRDFHRTTSVQLVFILYLLLGQALALFAWRLVTPRTRGEPTWLGRLAFVSYLLLAQVALFVGWRLLVGLYQLTEYVVLADLVVTVHFGLVIATLLLLVLLPVGAVFGWQWTRNFWLRLAQLLVIEVVAGQALVGLECPLTTLERNLRGGTGQLRQVENASAIGRACNRALYFPTAINAPQWIVTVAYATVGGMVLLAWLLLPPRLPWRNEPAAPAAPREPIEPGPPPPATQEQGRRTEVAAGP